jgi:hypothetical protein
MVLLHHSDVPFRMVAAHVPAPRIGHCRTSGEDPAPAAITSDWTSLRYEIIWILFDVEATREIKGRAWLSPEFKGSAKCARDCARKVLIV